MASPDESRVDEARDQAGAPVQPDNDPTIPDHPAGEPQPRLNGGSAPEQREPVSPGRPRGTASFPGGPPPASAPPAEPPAPVAPPPVPTPPPSFRVTTVEPTAASFPGGPPPAAPAPPTPTERQPDTSPDAGAPPAAATPSPAAPPTEPPTEPATPPTEAAPARPQASAPTTDEPAAPPPATPPVDEPAATSTVAPPAAEARTPAPAPPVEAPPAPTPNAPAPAEAPPAAGRAPAGEPAPAVAGEVPPAGAEPAAEAPPAAADREAIDGGAGQGPAVGDAEAGDGAGARSGRRRRRGRGGRGAAALATAAPAPDATVDAGYEAVGGEAAEAVPAARAAAQEAPAGIAGGDDDAAPDRAAVVAAPSGSARTRARRRRRAAAKARTRDTTTQASTPEATAGEATAEPAAAPASPPEPAGGRRGRRGAPADELPAATPQPDEPAPAGRGSRTGRRGAARAAAGNDAAAARAAAGNDAVAAPATTAGEAPADQQRPRVPQQARPGEPQPAQGGRAATAEPAPAPGSERGSRTRRRGRGRLAPGKDPTDEPAAAATAEAPARPAERSTRLETRARGGRQGDRGRRRPRGLTEEQKRLLREEGPDRRMLVTEGPERTQIGVLEGPTLVEHYVTRKAGRSMVGNIYLGRVQNVLPGMEAAFVDIGRGRNAVLYAGEVNYNEEDLDGEAPRIEKVLKPGQPVLVQVTKDPIGAKGARLTAQVSLAGRYLVLQPEDNTFGISRRLPEEERSRLREILREVRPKGLGLIVRTAAEGASADDLRADLARLQARWEAVERKAKKASAPAAIYSEPELVVRVIRDIFSPDFAELVVDDDELYQRVQDYLQEVAPDLLPKLRKHDGPLPLFEEHRVVEQIHKALERKVWLPSGGSIVIDRTEAMTVIDVNTGKFVGRANLEETVVANNLEAADEIVRQLRLRDIGGIIIIDFIDMLFERNQQAVVDRLRDALTRDKTKSQVMEVSSLGLVQMTRKRVSGGLLDSFSETCPTCDGRGVVITHEIR